jgi:pimeloyl-ACP methyl ester carboxylesterase
MHEPSLLRSLLVAALSFGALASPTAAQEPQILSSGDVKSLNRKAADWFEAWMKYEFEADTPKARRSANSKLQKARESFLKDWDAKSRKADPMASSADIRAVFAGAFPYERQSASGVLKTVSASDGQPGYSVMLPKRYDSAQPYRTILCLPGFDQGKGRWVEPKDHYAATWSTSTLGEDTIVMLPELDAGLELDSQPDFSKPTAEAEEVARLSAVLGAAGVVQREFHVDRQRLILDAGDGSSAFALRLASYFPNRFAGLILRRPTDVTKELRMGSLYGVPILLLSSAETKDACDALSKALNAGGVEGCKVIEAKGAYPFSDSQADVDAWVAEVRRNLTPAKIVLEPNHDAFNDAYWVRLGKTESLIGKPADEMPRFVIEADKEANRIKVEARGVGDFSLLLNDDLIDLSKEFTVEVNGVLFKEKRDRNFNFMVDQMLENFDPSWVFSASFATVVEQK